MSDSMLELLDEMLAVAPDDLVLDIGRLRRAVLAVSVLRTEMVDPAPVSSTGLQPMRPVDGEVRRWRGIDVSCPSCKAKPGKGCVRMRTNGSATADLLPKGKLHQSRRDRAKGRN